MVEMTLSKVGTPERGRKKVKVGLAACTEATVPTPQTFPVK